MTLGFRFSDILKYPPEVFLEKYVGYRKQEKGKNPDLILPEELTQEERVWLKCIDDLRQMRIITDTVQLANKLLSEGKNILIEGAQAVLLDARLGCHPHNTSSHTTPQILLGYAGLPIQAVRDVIAVTKWYGTRVGGVNPPATMSSEEDELFLQAGQEFGATTGRPRKSVWPDFVMMNHAINMSHPAKIYITKADICPVKEVKIALKYKLKNGSETKELPMNHDDIDSVLCIDIPGWKFENPNIPPWGFSLFLKLFQEEFPWIKIVGIGTGPKREDIIHLNSEVHA